MEYVLNMRETFICDVTAQDVVIFQDNVHAFENSIIY